ncbi:MAG: hypothetical protein M0T84_05280 [Betaproteobacteria bacterium]|nr:hypothetical protein [Betaproteobacteria bacterium]
MRMIKIWRTKRELKHFCDANGIQMYEDQMLVANGLCISEFGYLLRYISEGALDAFGDLHAVASQRAHLLAVIDAELVQPVLREEQSLGIGHETAVYNMRNLRGIVDTIYQYCALLDAA